jgi:hypothetical protein
LSTAPPSPAELDAYREQADRFIAALDEEYYLHYAGHKETLDLTPIYEEHAELTELGRARALGEAADGARSRELWRFACEGYMGNLTREHQERIARLEAELEAEVDGDKVGYRMLRPTIANEPDREKRERLESARNELTDEHLNAIYLEAHRRSHEAATELGQPTYLDLYRRFGMELDELGEQCRALLDSTERLWEEIGDRFLRTRVGVGLDEAERWDVQRAFRAPTWDAGFPAARMLPALETTLSGLGIDLKKQKNVHLDVEQRPLKSPRAFCAPIEVPGKVMLVIQPIGGVDDWRALFHEAGHTEHFAHTSAELAMEERRLGDNAVTEGWAALLERLTSEPAWLNRMLDFPRADEFERESAAEDLYFLRRYCAKLLYELEFHGGADASDLQALYVELLSDAIKISPSPTDYLADLDSGFYASSYLRSWAFEAQLRDFLRERFGSTWFADRNAGSLLRELWSEGQRLTAEEMLGEVTGSELEMEAVAERIREPLAGAR